MRVDHGCTHDVGSIERDINLDGRNIMSEAQFIRTITCMPVDDILHATSWYEKALGLETTYLHEGDHEGEETNYAVMQRDGVEVHLVLDEPPPYAAPCTKAGVGYLNLHVKDVNSMYEEVKRAGIEITRGLETENWGATGFNLTDPSGNAVHLEQES